MEDKMLKSDHSNQEPPASVKEMLLRLKPYQSDLIKGFGCLLLSSPSRSFHPLVWMFVIDRVIGKGETQFLVPALLLMILVQGAGLGLGACQDRFFEHAGQQFIRDLRNRVFRKLNRQSMSYLHHQRMGDLSSRVISDIQTIQSSLINGFTSLGDELVSFIIVISIIVSINWLIGVAVIIPLVITFIVMGIYNKKLKLYYQEASKALGRVSARLQDSLAGHAVVQAFGRIHTEESEFQEQTEDHYQRSMKAVRLRTVLIPGVFFIGFATNVIMLGLGVHLVLNGLLTLGGLVAIRIYWWQLNSPMRTLATVGDLLQRARASSARVNEVLHAEEPKPEPTHPHRFDSVMKPIEFETVHFHYPSGKPVLRDLNFIIEPKTRIALAGTSGGGKTTLLHLLLRFYEPVSGRILCGNTDLEKTSREHWRSFIAPVFQDTFLFHASIRENLRYGNAYASDSDLESALARANALQFVQEASHGLDTVVGERGLKLSGGQRQRLGLARAFLADPEILILDEPTSSVEPESEKIILQSIADLMEGRTVILTSHRVSLFEQVDRILFLDQGQITEDGNHFELMRNGTSYAQLYRTWQKAEMTT
ncbi:MAG: ABC transporter ATP-binding protein [Verrucomicrobiota bacterium]